MNTLRCVKILRAAALFSLALFSLCGLSYAAHAPTVPETLLLQGTLPPETADGPFRNWTHRKSYFLVIAVNETDVKGTALPFAQVDGSRIVTALSALGYEPLDPLHPLLTGKDATVSAIMAAIKMARKKGEEATIVVYYTGHGAVGSKDLWLQTVGQDEVGEGQGISVANLLVQGRQTPAGHGFEGELVLILDACYSGQGMVSQSLTLGDLGRRATIFTSSSAIQESFSVTQAEVPQMSAFTYTLLQAIGSEWAESDSDHDGLLRWEELKLYATDQLRKLHDQGAVAQRMTPSLLTNYSEGFIAYRRDQVRIWSSSYRKNLQTRETENALTAHLQKLTSPRSTPIVPEEAQLLARELTPSTEDYYAQAIKATAQGDSRTARALFAKADQQSQERYAQSEERHANASIVRQREQGEIALARARMETYDGKFTEAFTLYQQVGTITLSTTPKLLNEIGLAGLRAGRYTDAGPYLTQALQQREKELAPSHLDVAISLNNLAALYQAQGKYAEAEPLYQRAIHNHKGALGPMHPEVSSFLLNLASLYQAQGEYAKAEPLFKRVLTIREDALGPTHPEVATSLNNLAALYQAQGKYAEAEPLLQRALCIDEGALGVNHPDVAVDLNNLALLYEDQEKYSQAEPLFQRALTIRRTALGPQHPDVATSLNNLATLYVARGKYAEAEPLYQRALNIGEGTLGPMHPRVATFLNNLATLYQAQGRYTKADPIYQRSFWITYPLLGLDHPRVADVLINYRRMLEADGQPHDAKEVVEKLQSSRFAQPGALHAP